MLFDAPVYVKFGVIGGHLMRLVFCLVLIACGCVSVEQKKPQFLLRVLVVDKDDRPVKGAVVTATVTFQQVPLLADAPRLYPLAPVKTDKNGLASFLFVGPIYRVKRTFILWSSTTASPLAIFAIVGLTVIDEKGSATTSALLSYALQKEFCFAERSIRVRLGRKKE